VVQLEPQEVAECRDLTIDGPGGALPLRLYRGAGTTAGTPLPCLVFYHGGGWVIGDLESHDALCRALANAAGCAVVAVDYRLAPEHRFPAAAECRLESLLGQLFGVGGGAAVIGPVALPAGASWRDCEAMCAANANCTCWILGEPGCASEPTQVLARDDDD
jgi:hypothetical protein